MKFGWETPEERTRRLMKISPHQKMLWLEEMRLFLLKSSTPKMRKIRQKMRESR